MCTHLLIVIRGILNDGIPIELCGALPRRQFTEVLESLYEIGITISKPFKPLEGEILRELVELEVQIVEPAYSLQLFRAKSRHRNRAECGVVLLKGNRKSHPERFFECILPHLMCVCNLIYEKYISLRYRDTQI